MKKPLKSAQAEPEKKNPLKLDVKDDVSVGNIFKDSLILLKKAFFPTLCFIFVLSVIGAIIWLVLLTNYHWSFFELTPQAEEITNLLESDPSLILTDEQQQIQLNSTLYFITILIFQNSFQFIPLIGMLLFMTVKLYYIYTQDPDVTSTWGGSIKAAFSSKKQAATSIFMFFGFTLLIPVGIIMLYIPGFLLMIYGFFSFHSLLLDEKWGIEALRGGVYYAKENFLKILLLIFFSIFIPMLLSLLYSEPLLNLIGMSEENFEIWLNPESRNYGLLFVYYFCKIFFQDLLYFWFPSVFVVAFVKIRNQKLSLLQSGKKSVKNVKKDGVEIKVMEITLNQRNYHCSVCGKKLPLSAKKCSSCGQLYRLVIKRK